MKNIFDITLQNRKTLYNVLVKTPKEQLLKIPKGYRNNIWWNIAHIVVTQQLLVYRLSNLPVRTDEDLIDKFKKGTAPDGIATDEEMDRIKAFLVSTVEWMQEDYENGVFKDFSEYTTSAKVTLKNVEDAMAFNLFHEGLHLGVIISLQKALLK